MEGGRSEDDIGGGNGRSVDGESENAGLQEEDEGEEKAKPKKEDEGGFAKKEENNSPWSTTDASDDVCDSDTSCPEGDLIHTLR